MARFACEVEILNFFVDIHSRFVLLEKGVAAGLLQEELFVVWLDAQGLFEDPDGFYHVLELDFELG